MSPRAACRLEALGFDRVYDYVDGISDWKAAGLAVEGDATSEQHVIDATRRDVPTCRPDETIAEVRAKTTEGNWDVCVVVDCDRMAIGRIRGSALEADASLRAVEVMEIGPSTVRPDSLLQPLAKRMHERNAPHVLVTTAQGTLIGILLREEADRLIAGKTPSKIWQDCECCPGRWTTSTSTAESS